MTSKGQTLKKLMARAVPGLVLVRGPKGASPRVAVTFDDGPHASHTGAILDVLAGAGAQATFFLQGSEAVRHPSLVRLIDGSGHQLGNHGWAHSRVSEVGLRAFVREAVDTQVALEDTVGRSLPRIYRPPYGSLSLGAFAALARKGFRFVLWSIDSGDSFTRDPVELARRVAEARVKSGDVLLFHEDYEHTVAALPAVVAALQAQAFALVRVDEL